jgi:aromatic ring-opening dioxygenase LigB subunit
MPHGDIIPLIAPDYGAKTAKTHDAVERIALLFRDSEADVLLVLTPHGFRVEAAVTVSVTERTAGELIGNESTIQVDLPIDQLFALSLTNRAKAAGVPVATVIFGSSAGNGSVLPLDWGALVPLWYLTREQTGQQKVVIAVPSRSVNPDLLYSFGRAAAEAARDAGLRLAVVASADWSHTHLATGPYGYSPAAKELDRIVVKAAQNSDLRSLARISDKLIEDAKPDGIWQAIILAGALDTTSLVGEVLCYEAPMYYGMLSAVYTEVKKDRAFASAVIPVEPPNVILTK